MDKDSMIEVTYHNESMSKEFHAYFETVRGASMFIDTLNDEDIKFSANNY